MKKKQPLFLLRMIVVSSVLVACIGVFLKYRVLKPLGIERDESLIALPFVILADDTLQYQIARSYDLMMNPPTEPPETKPPTVPTEITGAPTEVSTEAPTEAPTEPPVTEPVYVAVDESWFDDVLFIGDSRSVGLKDMARLGQADYFCAGSMSVFTVQTWNCTDTDFYKQKLSWVLENNSYGKVYIHLGLNEIGNDVDLIMEQYQSLIDLVRESQPDAYIILQAVMSITPGKASNPNFPIEHLFDLNARLKAITEAEPEVFRYSDVNTWISDEEGYMRPEMTFDGCHLYGVGYMEWAQFILEEAGWFGIP